MNLGKCPESVLKRSVIKQLNKRSKNILCRAGVGKGAAVVSGICDAHKRCDLRAVMHTEVFSGKVEEVAGAAVHAAVTQVLVKGARPTAVETAVILPVDFEEKELRRLMTMMDAACAAYDIEIVGGHTEYMPSVSELTVSVTALGVLESGEAADTNSDAAETECLDIGTVKSADPKPGDDIVMVKWAGYYGSAVMANRKGDILKQRFYPDFINETEHYFDNLCLLKEISIIKNLDISVLYGIAKGGIFGALWEVAVAGKVGLLVDLKKIPLKQQTVEICNYFDINPYKLDGYGALLIGTAQGEHLVAALEREGIEAAVIGQFNDTNDRVVVNDDEVRFLEPGRGSELWKFITMYQK